jgi:hypothetical protein
MWINIITDDSSVKGEKCSKLQADQLIGQGVNEVR